MDITSFFTFTMICYLPYGVSSTRFIIFNNCPFQIMPGVLTVNGSADTTGFTLESQTLYNVTVSNPWNGRIWGRYGCSRDNGTVVCDSGDCRTGEASCNGKGWTPPATILDFSAGFPKEIDIYDVSLLDGFNLPLSIHAVDGNNCTAIDCPDDINKSCPTTLKSEDPSGNVIGCKSACVAFNEPEFCCSQDYHTPDKCQPNLYSQFFKSKCPMTYSYPYDDDSLTSICDGAEKYGIIFCP